MDYDFGGERLRTSSKLVPKSQKRRVKAKQTQIIAFRSAQNHWNEIGSDATLEFQLRLDQGS